MKSRGEHAWVAMLLVMLCCGSSGVKLEAHNAVLSAEDFLELEAMEGFSCYVIRVSDTFSIDFDNVKEVFKSPLAMQQDNSLKTPSDCQRAVDSCSPRPPGIWDSPPAKGDFSLMAVWAHGTQPGAHLSRIVRSVCCESNGKVGGFKLLNDNGLCPQRNTQACKYFLRMTDQNEWKPNWKLIAPPTSNPVLLDGDDKLVTEALCAEWDPRAVCQNYGTKAVREKDLNGMNSIDVIWAPPSTSATDRPKVVQSICCDCKNGNCSLKNSKGGCVFGECSARLKISGGNDISGDLIDESDAPELIVFRRQCANTPKERCRHKAFEPSWVIGNNTVEAIWKDYAVQKSSVVGTSCCQCAKGINNLVACTWIGDGACANCPLLPEDWLNGYQDLLQSFTVDLADVLAKAQALRVISRAILNQIRAGNARVNWLDQNRVAGWITTLDDIIDIIQGQPTDQYTGILISHILNNFTWTEMEACGPCCNYTDAERAKFREAMEESYKACVAIPDPRRCPPPLRLLQ